MKFVLATGNKGKVAELAKMLETLNIEIAPQSDWSVSEVAETGTTFVENAIIKARHAAKITGLPAIADDSGLEVDALNGAPGIYSSRYSGNGATDETNNTKLLAELADNSCRTARFRCVLVFMRHDDPTPLICQGTWNGQIANQASGASGFGYDPIFIPNGMNITAAELSKDDKNALSHRGQALRELVGRLAETKP